MKPNLLTLMLFLYSLSAFAQTTPFCGADELHQQRIATDSTYAQQFQQIQEQIRLSLEEYYDPHNPQAGAMRDLTVLPVVVHIVSPPGTALGSGNNVSDAEVQLGLQYLNDAYANTGIFYTPTGINTDIQFALAVQDPQGQPTNGIMRHESNLVNDPSCLPAGFDMSNTSSLIDIEYWDGYVNVYLVTDIEGAGAGCAVAGYASIAFPCLMQPYIVQESRYWISSEYAHITAHEMGHYFGLYHTFQGGCANSDCLSQGDGVCDTPPDNDTFTACDANTCDTDADATNAANPFSGDVGDDTANFMDYSECTPFHFTDGQKQRMHTMLAEELPCLLHSNGLIQPCWPGPTASLSASDTEVETGTTVNFTGSATNAVAYSYRINNNAPFANTLNASYQFTTVGEFWVKFTATDANNCSATALVLIKVSCNIGATFTATDDYIDAGESVTFSGAVSGANDFGYTLNGVAASEQLAFTHFFEQPGTYIVCLNAQNNYCNEQLCKPITVKSDDMQGCWQSISAGYKYSLALKTDGTLWAWGHNGFGQIGDGTNINKNAPIQIGNATNWQSISAGNFFSLALKTDGTLWAWGRNLWGQLGDGTNTDKNSPTQIGVDTDWQSIIAGDNHSLALKTDGTLWAWGLNFYGQFGDGTNTSSNTPTQIGSSNDWQSISGGNIYSLALKTDGSLWAWGSNEFGELGDGTNIDKNIPIYIKCPTFQFLLGINNLPCAGLANGALSVQVIELPSAPYTYTWSLNSGEATGSGTADSDFFSINNLAEGHYSVTVVSAAGYTAVNEITTAPMPGNVYEMSSITSTNASNDLSNGAIQISAQGGTPPYSYSWSGPSSGSSSSNANDFAISNLAAGDYLVIINDASGLSLSHNISIIDETAPENMCHLPMDIVILNDVSLSVDATEYQESKQFFVDFLNAMNIGTDASQSRAAMVEWSDESAVAVHLNTSLSALQGYIDLPRFLLVAPIPTKHLVLDIATSKSLPAPMLRRCLYCPPMDIPHPP